MIVLGAFVRLGLDELSGWKRMTRESLFVGLLAYGLSCVCLVLLLVDILPRGERPRRPADPRLAPLRVGGLPARGLLRLDAAVRRPDTLHDLNLSLTKDIAYSCLTSTPRACSRCTRRPRCS